ncbi:hypothetical protein [Methylobacterium flocculans]|nr:hypothetical protein [Methylobacterium sp. FF17]
MQLAVKHTLEVLTPKGGELGPDSIMMPIREGETSVMGETVAGFLARAG